MPSGPGPGARSPRPRWALSAIQPGKSVLVPNAGADDLNSIHLVERWGKPARERSSTAPLVLRVLVVMIYYSSAEASGFKLLFVLYGSVIPRALPYALLSGALGYIYEVFDLAGENNSLVQHPYAFHVFGMVLGFVLVQRNTLAYQRWWDARGSIAQVQSKWGDTCTAAAATPNAPGLERRRSPAPGFHWPPP